MSDIQDTTHQPMVEATEPTTAATTHLPETTAAETAAPVEDANPLTDGTANEAHESTVAPVEEKKLEATPGAEKVVAPITEGQLGYKGPGLLKSLVPSKKEFWLSDSPVTPQHLDMYMRGEKAEVSNPIVAWASQTGKGLLFFNKKGETERTRPHSVLPLYEATDLSKSSPHEIIFHIHGQKHTLKAANDAERDGWYMSLERAMEMGKADKEAVRAGEGYKGEMEKLNKPNVMAGGVAGAGAGAGAAAALRSKSQPKKSTEIDNPSEPRRTGSSDDDLDKKQKSRSTSRGIMNKLKGKKDEVESKREEKKEEKAIEKEEKKEEKAEAKAEKHGEAAPVLGGAALDAPSTAERVMAAPVEDMQAPAAASSPATDASTTKPNKRASIFGRMSSNFGSMKSPTKEKEMKDAELKPDVPPKDAGVSDTAPQLPEPATETMEPAAAAPAIETTEPKSESKPAEAAKENLDAIAPTQPKGFLSSIPFLNKRNRSVSPSTPMKEAPLKQEETPAVPAKDETAVEPTVAAAEEPSMPVTENSDPLDKPVGKVEEPITSEPTSPPVNRRQSMFGNLGRRASKALKGYQAPRKENVAPAATDAKTEEAAPVTAADDTPTTNGESKALEAEPQQSSIGDAVPDAVHAGHAPQSSPTVTASA